MVEALKMIGEGDLLTYGQVVRIISAAYSNSTEWIVIIKDSLVIYKFIISENKWYFRNNDGSFKETNGVQLFKKLDQTTIRDMKLNEILE